MCNQRFPFGLIAIAPLALALAACTQQKPAQEPAAVAAAKGQPATESIEAREARVAEDPLKQAFFGEQHMHTSYSLDAYIGGARLTPDDAYRFARGEDVTLNGVKHNIVKPLDFAAVTDHAEYIGEMYTTQVPGAPGHDDPKVAELRGLKTFEDQERWYLQEFQANQRSGKPGQMSFYKGPETARSAWKDVIIKAAQDHYDPGHFTTIIGYEWTSVIKGGNMHRNVLFRDTKVPDQPLSAIDTADEVKLWEWMAQQEAKGSRLFAIPHNSNGSKGFMFEPNDNAGNPLTREYAERRAKWEPLIEMMQIKGNSEVVAKLWPSDEFADFENAQSMQKFNERTFKKENFVRWAVTKGLERPDSAPIRGSWALSVARTTTTAWRRTWSRTTTSAAMAVTTRNCSDAAKARSAAGSPTVTPIPARSPGSGPPATPVRPSGTRCTAARRLPPPARASSRGFLLAPGWTPSRRTPPRWFARATRRASRWAAR